MKTYKASFTVEATFIVSWFCLLIGSVIMLTFYIHDHVVLGAVADETAVCAALSLGRYYLADTQETDIAALLDGREVPLTRVYERAFQRMERELLCVTVETFSIQEDAWTDKVSVYAAGTWRIAGVPIRFAVTSEAPVISSESFSRSLEGEEGSGGE